MINMKRKASALDDATVANEWLYSDTSTTTTSPESAHTMSNVWHGSAIPYLNSRTRKRYRDGRPDEQTIHHNTMAKLFNAQRKMHDTEMAEQRRSQQVGSYLMSLDSFTPTMEEYYEPEPRQRSLDTFFGNAHHTRQQKQPWRFRPAFDAATDSAASCEDCSSPLKHTDDSMELDMGIEGSDFACAHCSRHVCDTCAVKGDRRICLECAIPGG